MSEGLVCASPSLWPIYVLILPLPNPPGFRLSHLRGGDDGRLKRNKYQLNTVSHSPEYLFPSHITSDVEATPQSPSIDLPLFCSLRHGPGVIAQPPCPVFWILNSLAFLSCM